MLPSNPITTNIHTSIHIHNQHRGLECFPSLADPAAVTLTYEDEDGDHPTIARSEGACLRA
jgi:hypothetical protein